MSVLPPIRLDDAEALLAELDASWTSSHRGAEPVRLELRIAGVPVTLESTDVGLFDRFRRSLAHLVAEQPAGPSARPSAGPSARPSAGPSADGLDRSSADAADRAGVTVRLWSLHGTATWRPRLPPVLARSADVEHRTDGRTIHVRFDHAARAVLAADTARDTAWCCIESVDDLPWWEEAAPLRPVWSWLLPPRGRHLAHAAAVGTTDGAVLLVGPGGSGKSTTALACHLDGLGYLGDDYCVVTVDAAPEVHTLYGTAKLRLDSQVEHGPLAEHLLRPTPPPGGKAVAVVTERHGAPLLTRAPIRCVAAISVGDGPTTRVVEASRASVLAALAPSSLSQLPGVAPSSFRAMADIVRSVPVCRIELGHDRAGVVHTIRSLLEDPPAATAQAAAS